MTSLQCSNWLELRDRDLDCEDTLGHKGKHRAWTSAESVGDRPRRGKARKHVFVKVEWDR